MEDPSNRVMQLKDVYLLMKRDYRISRNIRALWFFNHLNQTFQYTPHNQLVETNEELQITSVVPDDMTVCVPGHTYNCTVTPSTLVTFLGQRYRFVIILDLSPSVSSVDTVSCSVLYEKVHTTLSNFLKGLVLPFCLPGSSIVLTPEIHITILGYSPMKSFTSNQVLAQGLVVNQDNIDKILASLQAKLEAFETTLADNFAKLVQSDCIHFGNSYCDVRQGIADCPSSPMPKDTDAINNPEAGIVNMLRCGMLAIQLLPENSSAGLVVITDGFLGVPEATLFEFLLSQLRTSTIACTFLRIGEINDPAGHFGHIPHTEIMQFIATATFGSYFDTCPNVTGSKNTLNAYHRAMFMWSFQRGLEGFRFYLHDMEDSDLIEQSSSPAQLVQKLLAHPIHGKLASVMPNIRKRNPETKLSTSLFSILSVRLREGYTIRDIAITKDDTQIEVKLVLPWREYTRFEYSIRAAWPLDKNKNVCHTEITIEGSYDFLHDMTCTQIDTRLLSPFRSANVKKFWHALQGLSQTDQLMVHLQTFSTNPIYYNLPESIKKGVPLFYLPQPNSSVPELSTQLNTKDTTLNQFAAFWRPVVNLDIKVWQKWMHTHRIGIVLEHDIPLHKNIHIPNSSGRFSMVVCRQAMTSLNIFLKEWSTFVLLDNQSYIKLMYEDEEGTEGPPSSFLLLRITSKAPCLVLRVAFLGGTPGYQRYAVVKELKRKVSLLKFPQRGAKADKQRRAALVKRSEEKGNLRKVPLLREWAEIFCCVLLAKPVESILIRYERVPSDMTKLEDQLKDVTALVMSHTQSKNKSAANLFNSLSRYLLHRRWVWTVQQPTVNSISMQGIGRILSTLAKMRVQQGFHFSQTSQGIVSMMLEVEMKDPESKIVYPKTRQCPTCVVQYILFPPYLKTAIDSFSDDEADEMESTEDDGELQIVTECWVEPQHGISINNTPERKLFDGLTCYDMAQTFYPLDRECLSSLLTFEHLLYLCHNSVIPADLSEIVNAREAGSSVNQVAATIEHITFPFDLLSILPRSQQAELIFPSFTCDPDNSSTENQKNGKDCNNLLFTLLFEQLAVSTQRDVVLSPEQSLRFLHQLQSRPRATDLYPFPFEVLNFAQNHTTEQSEVKVTENDTSQMTEVTVKASQSKSSVGGTESKGGQQATSPQVPTEVKGQPSPVSKSKGEGHSNDEIQTIPQFKCFIKSVNNNALLLTVVPASFNDLILMHHKEEESRETDQENIPELNDTIQTDGEVVDNVPDLEPAPESRPSVDKSGDTSIEGEVLEFEQDSKSEAHVTPSSSADTIEVIDNISGDATADARTQREESSHTKTSHCKETRNKEEKRKNVPLNIPVYVYDCVNHNVLDSLINPWDFQLPADIYHDLTFDLQQDVEEGALPSSRLKRVSFSLEAKDEVGEDGSLKPQDRRGQERRSTEGSNEGGENLPQHCSSLSETFYQCYVKGVFKSLQKGFPVESQDVDAAINNICEESLPLETNMTAFLHASCGHLQRLVNEARKEHDLESQAHDLDPPSHDLDPHNDEQTEADEVKRPSVRFMDIMDDMDCESDFRRIPSVLEIPHMSVTLNLASLHLDLPCEPISGLHELIKDKFYDIVQKWFRPVPSSPEYYFYSPEILQTEELSDEREVTASDTVTGGGATLPNEIVETTEADFETNIGVSDKLSVSIKGERISITSVLDSEESLEDEIELDLDAVLDDHSEDFPLFINFTCTVWLGKRETYSISMKSIAACLSELSTILESLSEIELGQLQITIDLTCLTLPTDLDTASPRRQSYLRMLSNSSLGSPSSYEPTDLDHRNSTYVLFHYIQTDFKHLGDILGHLPAAQHDSVTKCMEEIEWLLRDEIVSNLLLISPINAGALHYVMDHIQCTTALGKANTSMDQIPLQFVFGPDQSMQKFTEEFLKMNIPTYQLVKEGDLYYLAKRLLRAVNSRLPLNAVALSSALGELTGDGPPIPPNTTLSPREKSFSPFSPGYKSEGMENTEEKKGVKNISPLVGNTKDKVFDIGRDSLGRSSPLTVKLDKVDGVSDVVKEQKCDTKDHVWLETKKPVLQLQGPTVEGTSLLSKCTNKDLVLRLRRASSDSANSEHRKSLDAEDMLKMPDVQEHMAPVTQIPKSRHATPVTDMSKEDKTSKHSTAVSDVGKEDRISEIDVSMPMKKPVTARRRSSGGSSDSKSKSTESVASSLPCDPHHGTVTTDVSIQLTKTDGRSESFHVSQQQHALQPLLSIDDSFDEDHEDEGILKRCSSFAGFRSDSTCENIKQAEAISLSQAQSPVKGTHPGLPGPLGRLRHFSAPLSGQGTPKSKVSTQPQTPSWISSRGSFTEDAYDGDMSEVGDDSATSFSESSIMQRLMPNFWLILRVSTCAVDLFFHRRETGRETNEQTMLQRNLLVDVRTNVENTCRKVNQQLLLDELYSTRICHALLVPEADEEISWNVKQPHIRKLDSSRMSSSSENDDEDDDIFEHKYLAAAMDLAPGYFDCQCIWKCSFVFHPRLKSGSTVGGRGQPVSRGIHALRTVLDKFSVANRKNMFVIKENNGNVSYLRLKELTGVQTSRQVSMVSGEDLAESVTLPSGFRKDSSDTTLTAPEKDLDTLSVGSSSSSLSLHASVRGGQDSVELSVHGIEEAGKEIKEDLVEMLQNRLDEFTLDSLSAMFLRNTNSKLMPEDVQYIQKLGSEPTFVLHLTVSSKASPQLAAVLYYLHQNVLQFLHPPKYTDSNPDSHFMDTYDGQTQPIPSDQAYLYIQPHTARKTGIACLSISLVDGHGHQVKLLQCARPSNQAHEQISCLQDLEAFVSTWIYEMKPQSRRPGPTALIQFHIWERGFVNMNILTDKLIGSLKHALSDVAMEYYVLTAPICEIPKHLQELLPHPTLSAPSSPFCSTGDEFRERKLSMVALRKVVADSHKTLDRRPSFQTHSALQSIKDAFRQSTKRVMSPPPDTSKTFELPTLPIPQLGQGAHSKSASPDRGSPRTEPMRILSKYEGGERGTLHRLYTDMVEDWFRFCSSIDSPAINTLTLTLRSRFSMDCILHEFQTIVNSASPGTTTKVFKLLPAEDTDLEANLGVLYNPMRTPLDTGRRKSETSLDSGHNVSLTPGEDRNFIAVGRNLDQWHSCVQHGLEEEHYEECSTPPRGKPSVQKFPALLPSASTEAKSIGVFADAPSFVPRQRFVMMSLKNKPLCVYTYNWTNEMFSSLSKYMTRLVSWNNARAHLLTSIITQKMGLYNHYLFGDVSTTLENSSFTQQPDFLENLIKNPAPQLRDNVRRTNSVSSHMRDNYLPFDASFKDLFPMKPLHLSHLAPHRDPVTQYGLQTQEIRHDYKREFDKITNIRNLYVMWVQKTAPNYPISEETMRTLKQASRLFHYCATPMLFSSHWRQNVLEKYKVTRHESISSATTTAQRSRNSSGASTGSARTKRTDSTETKKRPSLSNLAGRGSEESLPPGSPDPAQEDEWHYELRSLFICQYIKYLQSIGFLYVQMSKVTVARKTQSSMAKEEAARVTSEEVTFKPNDIHNLQKTVAGGVLLVEISFRQEYFCVKLYTCDHNKLGITVNQQLKLLFVDECEKCKSLIHVHSFAHDFHLRCIQSYISGQQSVFKPGYYLAGLLTDFGKIYPYAPGFSRNFLQKDVVTIPQPTCSSQQLWEYMLNHAKLHNMNVVRMLAPIDADMEEYYLVRPTNEYALTSHETRELVADSSSSNKKPETYYIGLIIVQEPPGPAPDPRDKPGDKGGDRCSLQLQFYNILTSSQKFFPMLAMERKTGAFISKLDIGTAAQVTASRNENTDYLGYYNTYQPPMYKLLQGEAVTVKSKIEKMAVVSMEKCRRDVLWNKMLIGEQEEDLKRKKKSDSDDTRDPLSRLTYDEFVELLERVHKVPLHEMDPRLVPFLHMGHSWFQGLTQVLNVKYQDNVKRCFSSPDGFVQYHVILNPKFLDVFMLLAVVSTAGRSGLFAVFRKPAKEQESIYPGSQSLPEQDVQSHMENFINACCFHLWSTMLT